MVVTPWGRSDELRSRKLRPGPGASREEVKANQRERLFGAMVAAVEERGYEKTRVADLLETSGVSRNTFYKHFGNKRECFFATVDAVTAAGSARVVAAYEGHDGTWDERLSAALLALVDLIVEHPAAGRLYYVETYTAGPEAIRELEAVGDRLETVVRRALEESPRHAEMPREIVRAVLRGLHRIIQTRLRSGRERRLLAEGPELLRWALGYRTPPQRLVRPRKPPARAFATPPAPPPHQARDRIMTAVIELMAEQSYQALKITDIAQRAAISLTTFYAHFDGKDDAVVAALRRAADRALEATAPAYHQAPDWPHAIGATVRAFFAFLAIERPFAQFGGVGSHSGSRLVVEVRHQLLTAGQEFLAEGYRQHPEVHPIVGEAIGAALDALLFDQVLNRGPDRLYEMTSTATYVALVPFVGPEEACAVANRSR
ncbi:MAG: TetR/AcrR family transcriptional regulator [Thermoleophilaceae bacterium]